MAMQKRASKVKAARKPKAPVSPIVLYPRDVQKLLNISFTGRWRLEKQGRLPPRDVFLGVQAVGWRPETLEAWFKAPSTPPKPKPAPSTPAPKPTAPKPKPTRKPRTKR